MTNRGTADTNRKAVDERWAKADSGAHYVGDRWRGGRARERDPRLIAKLLARLRTGPDQGRVLERVLDAPCGTGRLLAGLRRLVPEAATGGMIVECDISMSMLDAGRATDRQASTLRAGDQVWLQGSASELPLASDSFDLVVCCRLLHHLTDREDRRRIVRELVRVSRGYVMASYWDAQSYAAWRRRTTGPLRRRRRPDVRSAAPWQELNEDIEAAGATVIDRAHSMRFVSQQAFFLARKNR